MADLSLTEANIQATAATEVVGNHDAGEALDAGDVGYVKKSDGKVYRGDNNATGDGADEKAEIKGIVMNKASAAGHPVRLSRGQIAFGSVIAVAEIYVLSTNAGKIKPFSELGSGERFVPIGYGVSATVMDVLPKAWGRPTPVITKP